MTKHTIQQLRPEEMGLITGCAHYVDDIRLPVGRPPILHMLVVRSPYAHARIEHIDAEAACAVPGVIAVLTGQDLLGKLGPLENADLPDVKATPRPLLAVENVLYIGAPVAVVLATNSYQAADAHDLVDVDYQVLEVVSDAEAGKDAAAPLLYPEIGSNIALSKGETFGKVDEVFSHAAHVTCLRLSNPRVAPSSLEARACLFDYNIGNGMLYAWLSSQNLFRAKNMLADLLTMEPERIHVQNATVGGAFGAKNALLGEEFVAAWLAHEYGQPVKWIEDRSENLQAQAHGRGQINSVEAAFESDGRLLGLKIHTIADIGAFPNSIATIIPQRTVRAATGPYRVEAVASHVECIYTNKPPMTPYRGAGRPEATFIAERTMDQIARELHLDPAEVRRRNFIAADAFPYRTITGQIYDSGNYPALLARVLELGAYEQWRVRQREQRTRGGARLLGLGLSTFVEMSGATPDTDHLLPAGAPKDAALVRLRPDGTVLVQSGVAHTGQGHFTLFAQIVAPIFGIPAESVVVALNTTDLPHSRGTFGSRVTQIGGSAVHLAAKTVREKALQAAAHILKADLGDLKVANGTISVHGKPWRSIDLGSLVKEVQAHPELLPNTEPLAGGPRIEGLAAWQVFAPDAPSWSAGAHLAVVEVDIETGQVEILRYTAVDDCGRVLHQALAEGQLYGSLAQGIGQALFEEIIYDQNGQILSGTLMDYALPLAKELPTFTSEFMPSPSPTNVLGAKGIGEAGTVGAPSALVNAVLDALAPLGVSSIDMPMTRERVWKAVQLQANKQRI